MDYTDPVAFANAGRAIARTLIKASYVDAADAVADDLANAYGLNVVSRYVSRTQAVPGWGVWSVGDWIWAFIEGCSFLSHGLGTATGYTGTPVSPITNVYNDYFSTVAASVATEIRTRPGYQTANVRFVGHSLGGAVAEAAALEMIPELTRARCAVCTFGAPKFGTKADCERVGWFSHARYFNEDDPVPLVFPTVNDNPAIAFALTPIQLLRVQQFTQPAGGLELTASGTIRPASVPSVASIDAVSNIGAWLLSIDSGIATPHDLDTYVQRFGLWLQRGIPPAANPRPEEVVLDPAEISRVNLNRVQREVIRRVRVNEAAQHATAPRIPRQHLCRVIRVGALWCVVWGDQTLAATTRKRSALRIKNTCNKFLEGLLQMGIVDILTLNTQLQSFIDAAQQPGSGVEPQLVVEVPE